jgi:DNA-binding CsgD family transcriptional regulator
MGHVNSLVRADQVRALYRVLGETREILRTDTRARAKQHAIGGLCRILGGCIGAIVVDADHGPGRDGRLVEMNGHGFEGNDVLDMAGDYLKRGPLVDPALVTMRERTEDVVSLLREELVDDRGWFGSGFVSETRKKARVGEAIYSKRRAPTPFMIDALCVNRPWGDRPFVAEDRNLVQLFQVEADWLYAANDGATDSALSRRERETLTLLLAGSSEKEIARQLALSPHTVHGYVKTLYRRFGATSRAQLLALCLGGSR